MAGLLDAINVALIAGSMSVHHTTEHAPKEGYNQTHNSLGVHVKKEGDGWQPGVMGMRFEDSFGKTSQMYVGTMEYQKSLGDFHASAGAGAGYVKTSYYEGPYVAPLVEVGYKRFSIQLSHQLKVPGGDSVTAAQLKIKLN